MFQAKFNCLVSDLTFLQALSHEFNIRGISQDINDFISTYIVEESTGNLFDVNTTEMSGVLKFISKFKLLVGAQSNGEDYYFSHTGKIADSILESKELLCQEILTLIFPTNIKIKPVEEISIHSATLESPSINSDSY